MVCVRVCALLSRSLVTVSGHLATREFRHQPTRYRKSSRHQPTRHQETITPPTKEQFQNTPPRWRDINRLLPQSRSQVNDDKS